MMILMMINELVQVIETIKREIQNIMFFLESTDRSSVPAPSAKDDIPIIELDDD